MTHRIVQITDCHLFADPSRELRDIATWPRFLAALRAIDQQVPDCDYLVMTGDTAHDEEPATYEAVRQVLGDQMQRVRIIPGNHDDRASLRSIFPEACGHDGQRVTFHVRWADWQMIGLDSHLPGETSGRLGDEQRAWLGEQLTQSQKRSTLLFLHHPPIHVQSPWLDAIGLEDAADFERLLRDCPHVRLICCGHVHQELAASLAGATVLATPAVGPQFRPRTEQLEIDPGPPCFRLIELHGDGQWSTQVLRVT
jgi:Icc protein